MKSDIFSTGVVLYSLLTKSSLFSGTNEKSIIRENIKCFLNAEKFRKFSFYCQDLLKKMLVPIGDFRPSSEECLKHEWFDGIRENIN
jgi:serine/threonine protein kinase